MIKILKYRFNTFQFVFTHEAETLKYIYTRKNIYYFFNIL